jgi:hypothetical protein
MEKGSTAAVAFSSRLTNLVTRNISSRIKRLNPQELEQ